MPHGKKNKRGGRGRNNKQKKGAGHGKNANRNPAAGTTAAPIRNNVSGSNTSNLPLTAEHAFEGTAPPIRSFQPFQQREQALHENYPTIFFRYKAATNRFFKYMQDNSPESIHDNKMNVNSLMSAADWMEENKSPFDPTILKDLKLAIRVRSRVAKSIFGGGDSGHKHLLTVLVYCWGVLISLPRGPSPIAKSGGIEIQMQENLSLSESDVAASRNRFEALTEEDMDEDNEFDEIFPSEPVPRPPSEPEPMSLEDLMTSDERHDIHLFLISMDELMRHISEQYSAVARNIAENKRQGIPGSAIVENLMEAAIATNMAIQQVNRLDMDFEAQYPHISTPYRLLSTLVLPEFIENIAQIVRKHGKKVCPEREVALFLGDCVECHFRSPSDPENKMSVVVPEFCKQYEIDSTGFREIQQLFQALGPLVSFEVPTSQEIEMNKQIRKELKRRQPSYSSHSWIPRDLSFIGGDRAIHHTMRLLQNFGLVAKQTKDCDQIFARRGFFGQSPWLPGRSRKIHNDLDEKLMADILPQWFLLCRNGILGIAELPRQNEIAPFWACMKRYFNAPGKPVSWSCVFAVHAMLTAILETDKVTRDITMYSKSSFDLFFRQLEKVLDLKTKEADSLEGPGFKQNMACLMSLQNFGLPVFGDSATWNPVCGGTTFLYLSIFGNLEAGCALVDDRAQLRIVLYLYHALRVNNILQKGRIPLLDIIFGAFKDSLAIWAGPLPRKGQCAERFWVAFGASRGYAASLAKESKEVMQMVSCSRQQNAMIEKSFKSDRRKMSPLDPAEIATSFRRICNRDFHDVVDRYHTPEQRQRNRGSDSYTFAVQINDTLDAMEREQRIYALNLPSLGVYLEQFVCSLTRVFQWDPIILRKQSFWGNDKRQGAVFMFAQYLLGALDYAGDPKNIQFFGIPQGLASSEFMAMYFNRIDPTQVMWFQPTSQED